MTHLKSTVVFLTMGSMLLSGPMAAAQSVGDSRDQPVSRAASTGLRHPRVGDVALSEQGTFRARILSRDGLTVADQTLTLSRRGETVATAVSDNQGQIAIPGLTGGQYEMHVANETSVIRIWTAKAAPPIASKNLLIVPTSQIERAQQPLGNFFAAEPVMIGVLIAAAIAIPIAVHQSGS